MTDTTKEIHDITRDLAQAVTEPLQVDKDGRIVSGVWWVEGKRKRKRTRRAKP